MTDLSAVVLSCTLKKSPAPSSSVLIGEQVLEALRGHGVTGEVVRVVDHDVHYGVSTDEGDGDEWPVLRRKILDADILVLATPIWLGQPASVSKVVLERLDAELAETDDQGRMSMVDKVALLAVVGNEDGAHHVAAELAQGLDDVGFTLPANAATYWVGEAMQGVDFNDHDQTPETTDLTTRTAALQGVHLARLLKEHPYPAPPG